MNDTCTYLIRLRGQVGEEEINALSPLQLMVTCVEPDATLFTVCTDQSGFIGVIRHLHGLGLVFLDIIRIVEKI